MPNANTAPFAAVRFGVGYPSRTEREISPEEDRWKQHYGERQRRDRGQREERKG